MPTDASVLRKIEVGLDNVITTVVSSCATALSIYVRSKEPFAAFAVSSVKATSSAVTFSPSVKNASSRIVKVHVSPSSDSSYPVARSFSKFSSALYFTSVLCIIGEFPCPQPLVGSSVSGSEPMAIMTLSLTVFVILVSFLSPSD